MNRLEYLLHRWQDSTLTESELDELKEILRTSSGRKHLVHEFHTIASITEEFKKAETGEYGAGANFPAQHPFDREGRSTRTAPWKWLVDSWAWIGPRRGGALASAAVAAIAACVWWMPGDPWHAKVARVVGEVTIVRDGRTMPATAGLLLQAGDTIRTPANAHVVVQDEKDASFFALEPDTLVKLYSSRWGKRLELTNGRLEADVAPQPRFRPMKIITPRASTTMLGTRFTLQATDTATRLDVIEGLVRMNGNEESGYIEVSTAHSARVAPDFELRSVARDVIVINFGPNGIVLPPGVLNDWGFEFNPSRGYGWEGPSNAGVIPGEFIEFQGRLTPASRGRNAGMRIAQLGRTDALHASHVQAGWLNHSQNWKMRLAPGRYLVTVCAGDSESPQGPLHVNLQGRQVIDHVFTKGGEFAEIPDIPIEVGEDGFLRMVVGGYAGTERMPDGSSDTTLNFLVVKRVAPARGEPL